MEYLVTLYHEGTPVGYARAELDAPVGAPHHHAAHIYGAEDPALPRAMERKLRRTPVFPVPAGLPLPSAVEGPPPTGRVTVWPVADGFVVTLDAGDDGTYASTWVSRAALA